MAAIDALATATAAATGTASTSRSDVDAQDRFLKLLVAQLKNQDPLNPLDNAQVTSQMAQIQTVAGVERLNTTVESLSGHFAQMQALQGASLVGRDVVVEGDRLSPNDAGLVQGGFELAQPADRVRVEVLSRAGLVIDTVDLGALGSGRHGFEWVPAAGVDATLGERFRVVAKSGTTAVAATPLMRDRVDAVVAGDVLTLELRHAGSVPYAAVKAFN
ncbi:flagellar hook assembly protein FlgD [Azohydromonas sediminis]|uniref:flagellar hook assembly protein FlgD n=1 Tax=Azohydromonas sediminis TaxID=2259674 RepID=UPI000E655E95|nr:flagellar hook capping FlgD N-terminal domain-containing protein [Azohydromonas sediminis]